MASTQYTDGRQERRVENYTKFWQKDLAKEGEADNQNRVESYTDVVNGMHSFVCFEGFGLNAGSGYYDGATELYEYGWAQSFHFSRFYKGEAFAASLARHEHYLAAKMSLRPGMRVLDVGCGVGGPAREIARFADVNIVGLNNNDFQIQRARKYTRNAGLESQVSYAKGDFMKLSEQFGENSFDAGRCFVQSYGMSLNHTLKSVYAIEATVHAPTWEGVYGEIMKVLKPGGVVCLVIDLEEQCAECLQFGVYEWCMTDTWDPSIPAHKELAHAIEFGNGIPEMRPLKKARDAMINVGFTIEHEEDLAERPDEVPWYYPLEGDIRKAQTVWDYFTVWRMSWSGKLVSHTAIKLMEMAGLLPKGTYDVGESLKVAGDALVKGGQTKVSIVVVNLSNGS